ncbi:hypothetical protein NC653_026077 [Populus alba x Populus x berolinensis]|uniref:Uncharacterized protein n=1 Tax=Populus alba x Populus x berolinensis TaxID=444605 RepID=A0AAD6MCV8_9ROSI|nr:hypothetical protein NC653_026077 [Populus alba x Populus x berolinensis]
MQSAKPSNHSLISNELVLASTAGFINHEHLFDTQDDVVSYMLATGAAAAFGATKDLKTQFAGLGGDKFFNKGYASASRLLLGFVCTAILSVFS